MKRISVLVAAFLLAFVLPAEAQVQSSFAIGPRVGIDVGNEIEEFFIGGDARFSSANLPFIINPTFDYYLVDDPILADIDPAADVDASYWAASLNALYPFGVDDMNQSFTPYAGAGVGIYRASLQGSVQGVTGETTTSDLGVNLIFGAIIPGGTVAPFAEAQYSPIFADDSYNLFTLKAGLLLGF